MIRSGGQGLDHSNTSANPISPQNVSPQKSNSARTARAEIRRLPSQVSTTDLLLRLHIVSPQPLNRSSQAFSMFRGYRSCLLAFQSTSKPRYFPDLFNKPDIGVFRFGDERYDINTMRLPRIHSALLSEQAHQPGALRPAH